MSTLKRLWLGEYPLSDAFWRFAVLYSLILNVAFSGLSLLLYFYWDAPLLAGISHVIPWFYCITATVGVWRSADRYDGPRIHTLVAKIALLALAGILILV